MADTEINPLIKEKIGESIIDENVQKFLYDILKIERDYTSKKGKIKEYEKALGIYVRRE